MLESKRRAIIFLTIAFVLALTAGFLFLQRVNALNSDLGGTTEVFIAATDIPSRTVLTYESVTTMELPNKFVEESNQSYVTNIEELAEQVLVVPVAKGQIITKNILKRVMEVQNENNRLVQIFQSGKVFFDFLTQEIEPGDRVDLIVSHSFDGKAVTEIFMKDVEVKRPLFTEEDGVLAGIEVEVSVEDAPELIHMQNYAESIRVLKANVAQVNQIVDESEEEATEEEKEAPKEPVQEEKPAEKEESSSNEEVEEEATTPEGDES